MAGFSVVWHRNEIDAVLHSRSGPAAADMLRRGNNVRNAAISNMRSMGIGSKTGTGALMQSITVELIDKGGMPGVRIGSRLPYASYVHEGHGWIFPKRGRFLRWPATASSGSPRRYRGGATAAYVYARKVRPVAGRPFLKDALRAALD